jgi:hypothetical protein
MMQHLIMQGLTKRAFAVLTGAMLICAAVGCETVSTEYLEEYTLQALLVVDEPLRGVQVTQTANVSVPYSLQAQFVRNADVRVSVATSDTTREYSLTFQSQNDSQSVIGYGTASNVLVLPEATYQVTVRLANGKVLSGSTRTPSRIAWTQAPKPVLQYPQDSVGIPGGDSLDIAWTEAQGVVDYLLAYKCLDTAEYGRYLNPATNEKNRRIYVPPTFLTSSVPPTETLRWDRPIPQAASTLQWSSFRWFGAHEISIYAPDPNWMNWYRMLTYSGALGGGTSYSPLLGNVRGGLGVVGSASVARQRVLLLKYRP